MRCVYRGQLCRPSGRMNNNNNFNASKINNLMITITINIVTFLSVSIVSLALQRILHICVYRCIFMHPLSKAYIHVYVLIRARICRDGVSRNLYDLLFDKRKKNGHIKEVKIKSKRLPRCSRVFAQYPYVIIN